MPIKLDPLTKPEPVCPTGPGASEEEPAAPIPAGSTSPLALEPLDETQDSCGVSSGGFAYGFFGGAGGEGQAQSLILSHGDLLHLLEDDHLQYQLRDEKGEPIGYAELDAFGKIPVGQHGSQPGGSLHALASATVPGFMSPTDKDKLDDLVIPIPVSDGGTGVTTVDAIRALLGLIPAEQKFPITANNTLIFVLVNTPLTDSERVYLNGQWLQRGASDDYTISGSTVTLLRPTRVGDLVSVEYSRF